MTAAVPGIPLARRLANFRAGLPNRVDAEKAGAGRAWRSPSLGAERLAAALDGELIRGERGSFVRVEAPSTILPLDRERLARLPGQPPAEAPLLCLDTETTGLATAAGTLAFLVGLGWWEGSRFRQIQLFLPDHADEPAFLTELARHIPTDGWLVTYNGRGFDWPLIVTRYRMAMQRPPAHAGHLDLLPLVRRVFRHRMTDARLATVETALLGLRRTDDVPGWEIPGRFLGFLRDGEPSPLVEVARHNDEDVRSLGRLLVHVDREYADRARWRDAPSGDLAGLARAFVREGRHEEALDAVDASLAGWDAGTGRSPTPLPAVREPAAGFEPTGETIRSEPWRVGVGSDDEVWWSPRRRPDYGGRPDRYAGPDSWRAATPMRRDAPWTRQRLTAERARLLRRLHRHREAESEWLDLTAAGGMLGVHAWIEVAKVREHHLGDLDGALAAAALAARAAERQRFVGRPLPRLELAVARRSVRLQRRVATRQADADRRAARRSTAARSGTPASPSASITSEAAAAANESSAAGPGVPTNS